MLKHALLPLAAAAFLATAGPAAAQTFPDGPGKEILEKKCSTCHAPEQVTTFGRSAEEWHEVVVNMIDLGAEVNEEEAKVLVEYLAKNWPVKGSTPPADKPADKPAEQPAPKAAASAVSAVASHGPSVTIREWDVPTPNSRPHDPRGGGRWIDLVYGPAGECSRAARSEDGTDQGIRAQDSGLWSARSRRGQGRQHLVHRELQSAHRQARPEDRTGDRISDAGSRCEGSAFARLRSEGNALVYGAGREHGRPVESGHRRARAPQFADVEIAALRHHGQLERACRSSSSLARTKSRASIRRAW